jgi:hypothetical protein
VWREKRRIMSKPKCHFTLPIQISRTTYLLFAQAPSSTRP